MTTTEGGAYIKTHRVTPIIPAEPPPSDEAERIYHGCRGDCAQGRRDCTCEREAYVDQVGAREMLAYAIALVIGIVGSIIAPWGWFVGWLP